jgi:ribosomal protein S18 acetylase RimI-like enzyme
MNDFARARNFEEALRDRCAERILPFAFGRALFNDTYPRVWDLNLLRVEEPSGATVELLAAEAERLHGRAGHDHRRIAIEEEQLGAELEPAFRALGWQPERFVFMGYRGPGKRAAETCEVREVDVEAVRPLREQIARREPWATDDEVVRMVLDADALLARQGSARHFAAMVEGEVASAADLLSDGHTAQIEDVVTHPDFRGRGLASSVVVRAVEEALATGHGFVFLVADDADWPKELYRRLGFAAIGRKWVFLRTPAPAGPAETPREAPIA